MEWVQVVIGILEIVAIIILGLFLKNYFPSYMDERERTLRQKKIQQRLREKPKLSNKSSEKTLNDFLLTSGLSTTFIIDSTRNYIVNYMRLLFSQSMCGDL